jgi:hypothetical protein
MLIAEKFSEDLRLAAGADGRSAVFREKLLWASERLAAGGSFSALAPHCDFSGGEPERLRAALLQSAASSEIEDSEKDKLRMLLNSLDDSDIEKMRARLAFEGDDALTGILFDILSDKVKRVCAVTPGRNIGLYYETRAYRENTGDIGPLLSDKGFNVMRIFGEVCGDRHEKMDNIYFGGVLNKRDFFPAFDGLDIAAHSYLTRPAPKNVKTVFFPHDMHDMFDTSLRDREGILSEKRIEEFFRCNDYVFCSLKYDTPPRCAAALKKIKKKLGIKKNIVIIPGGYIRLDRNIEYMKKHRVSADSIVYATTVIGEQENYIKDPFYASGVIEELLRSFPERKLIYRPHPLNLSSATVRLTINRFQGRDGFSADEAPGSYMPSYSKAAVLVTDMSGTAYTYAFSTLRPVVFYHPQESEIDPRVREAYLWTDREKIGYVARSVPELAEKVRLALDSAEKWKAKIRRYRDSIVFNVGCSERFFAGSAEYIIRGETRPEWALI